MANARERYREHNETIRRMMPPERLLEFKLADGWGPSCEFLGKEVPDVPFPRVNEAAEFQEMKGKMLALHWASFKRINGSWIAIIVCSDTKDDGMLGRRVRSECSKEQLVAQPIATELQPTRRYTINCALDPLQRNTTRGSGLVALKST